MVGKYAKLARQAGLTWPLPENLTDEALERLLYPPPPLILEGGRPLPSWSQIHEELRKPGVTLELLWQEYREVHPTGYGQSRFFELYRVWRGRLSLTMRQVHLAGEKMFVDYAGQTADVFDPLTGEVRRAQVFVAVLGASSYTYAEASWGQTLPEFAGAHVRAFQFFGGVARQLVPDNLKSAIIKACLYEPMASQTYGDVARHYRTAIVPARPRRPRDKAKVEVAVQVVERWILARLRHSKFFSLDELNAAIKALLVSLNDRTMRHLKATRRELFDRLDRPALMALPAEPYEYAEWKRCRPGLDYHVELHDHYYSVPHSLAKQELMARITATTIEVFHGGRRVASHRRNSGNHRHTTIKEHMPASHRRYADWTPERLKRDAAKVGSNAAILVDVIMRGRPHPEQGFRACVGILRLAKTYGDERLEAACERALVIGTHTYASVTSILKNGLDQRSHGPATAAPLTPHDNIRSPDYYRH